MNINPVRGKCIYRKDLIVQNWELIKWKIVTETHHKQIQIEMDEDLELNSISIYPNPTLLRLFFDSQ